MRWAPLLVIGLFIIYWLIPTSSTTVLEIKCVDGDLFDNAKRCNQVAKDQAGTVMDLGLW
jgi:hypothetical protein